MKFEEHEGKLFRMLDKPNTINEFSKTPCVIACKYGGLKKYYILDFPLPNPSMSMLAEGFEIIGYPVVDGSAEWALWAMMDGKKVWSFDVIDIIGEGYVAMGKWESSEVIAFHFVNTDTNYECNSFMSIDEFLSKHRSSGWQLYKEPEPEQPKPLLADAHVGDLCKTDLDEWIQIDDTSEPPSPILYHYDRPFKGNIIYTEPLAPEGSAEWALQMWKLGNDIRNETGVVLMSDYESEEIRVKRLVDVFPSGWQLYKEPEQPKYKVGDWVDCKDLVGVHAQCKVLEIHKHNVILGCKTGHRWSLPHNNIIRKLSPSEVIVRIGCLSGTIRYYLSFDNDGAKHDAIRIFNSNGKSIAAIHLDALDTSTSELVESLLEAMQEEEK